MVVLRGLMGRGGAGSAGSSSTQPLHVLGPFQSADESVKMSLGAVLACLAMLTLRPLVTHNPATTTVVTVRCGSGETQVATSVRRLIRHHQWLSADSPSR